MFCFADDFFYLFPNMLIQDAHATFVDVARIRIEMKTRIGHMIDDGSMEKFIRHWMPPFIGKKEYIYSDTNLENIAK